MKIKKTGLLALCFLLMSAAVFAQKKTETPDNYQVAAYYFPDYHLDERNQNYRGKGWTEWKLVKEARPRFKGHYQPNVPLWGYTDEADPTQMAQKIAAASSHHIDAFIFDWYYYNDGPFLQRGLEDGFMKASNNHLMKFGLMWANHDWLDLHPATAGKPMKLMYPGKISPETWDKMTDMIIAKYFRHPSYWKIDGCPYFSVYDLSKFLASFGTIDEAAKAIAAFREKTRKAGFKDLHINAVVWGTTVLPSEKNVVSPETVVKRLKFNSVTDYVWIHHVSLNHYPGSSYDSVKTEYFKYAQKATKMFDVPYYPNVSMGWDSSPRTNQKEAWGQINEYPYTPIILNNTPAAFKQALVDAKRLMDSQPAGQKILTINSWNEWTEGSYLEPDTRNKMAYLDAIKAVFGPTEK